MLILILMLLGTCNAMTSGETISLNSTRMMRRVIYSDSYLQLNCQTSEWFINNMFMRYTKFGKLFTDDVHFDPRIPLEYRGVLIRNPDNSSSIVFRKTHVGLTGTYTCMNEHSELTLRINVLLNITTYKEIIDMTVHEDDAFMPVVARLHSTEKNLIVYHVPHNNLTSFSIANFRLHVEYIPPLYYARVPNPKIPGYYISFHENSMQSSNYYRPHVVNLTVIQRVQPSGPSGPPHAILLGSPLGSPLGPPNVMRATPVVEVEYTVNPALRFLYNFLRIFSYTPV